MSISEHFNLEARREAREAVRHPGKFEGESPMTVLLYQISLNGGGDRFWVNEAIGEWAEQIGKWILSGSDIGFVAATKFPSIEEATKAMDLLPEWEDEYEAV